DRRSHLVRERPHPDGLAAYHAGCEGDRRGGHHRLHAGDRQRRGGRAAAAGHRARGDSADPAEGVGRRPGGAQEVSDETLAQVRRALDGLGVPYEIVDIDPDFADTAAFCEKYGFGLDVSGNTIIVASKKEPKQYVACLVLANTRLDVNHAVKRLMGASRVSFASAEETMALTGMQIGGVTVLALPPDLPVYVDDRIMALPWMILGAGT